MGVGVGVDECEALTCYLHQVCSGHILGVGAEPESQRWTQDTKKNKPQKNRVFVMTGWFFHCVLC